LAYKSENSIRSAPSLSSLAETAGDSAILIDARGSVGDAKQGERSVVVGIRRDLAEPMRAEELLAHIQKTEMAGLQIGRIAHDLNTLLTVIVGNAEFLSEKLDAREDLQQIARDIATAGDRGAELTQRLVGFGRR
jgi:signal transduction histidine kinase